MRMYSTSEGRIESSQKVSTKCFRRAVSMATYYPPIAALQAKNDFAPCRAGKGSDGTMPGGYARRLGRSAAYTEEKTEARENAMLRVIVAALAAVLLLPHVEAVA